MITRTLLLVSLLATTASAQDSSSAVARRTSASITYLQSRPQGELGKNIGTGHGVAASALFRLDSLGIISLRADLGIASYGTDVRDVAFSETVGNRVLVGVRTTNFTMPMSVGPQLAWPTGAVRPYVNAGVGGQLFFTESQVESRTGIAIASTTNQSDFALAWSAGGGVYIPFTVRSNTVMLDVGAQYMNGATASYLAKGSIVDLTGGSTSVTTLASRTNQLMLRVGARIGL